MATSADLVHHTEKIEALIQSLVEQNLYVFYYLESDIDQIVSDLRDMASAAKKWIIANISKNQSLVKV